MLMFLQATKIKHVLSLYNRLAQSSNSKKNWILSNKMKVSTIKDKH